MQQLRLGKLTARENAVKFKLDAYGSSLSPAPAVGGHKELILGDNNMFGNDQLGDCVCAEAAHGTIYYNKEAGKNVSISLSNVVAMYSAVTGYNPSDPNSDQGTDMQAAASYRRKTGLLDTSGKRHKILAYLGIKKGDKNQLKQSIYYFGGAGIGFQFPDYAMDEFNAGETWHVKAKGKIEGGHDVFAYGYDTQYVYVISWGKPIRMTWGFYQKYCDEAIAYLSGEMLTNNKSLEGFNLATLQADLSNLGN